MANVDLDLIERYYAGELTKAEEQEFEDRVANDPVFMEEASQIAASIEGIKNYHLKALDKEIDQFVDDLPDISTKIDNLRKNLSIENVKAPAYSSPTNQFNT